MALECKWIIFFPLSLCNSANGGSLQCLGLKNFGKPKAPNNCRFFIWLVLVDRCWTAEHLHHHGICLNNSCILCCQEVESIDHLMVQWVFSREFWFKVLRPYGWHGLVPTQADHFASWWIAMHKRVFPRADVRPSTR
jgi:hypothetical protein